MSYFLQLLMIFGLILTVPAMAQTPPLTAQQFYQQQTLLVGELRNAVNSGDKAKADQLRSQLSVLYQQQSVQRKQLSDALRAAMNSGDQQQVQLLKGELRDQLRPQSMGSGRRHRDPQETALLQSLQIANKSGDKTKADQIRVQLIALHKQQFAQMKQLHEQLRDAFKSGDKLKAQYLRDQILSMMP